MPDRTCLNCRFADFGQGEEPCLSCGTADGRTNWEPMEE